MNTARGLLPVNPLPAIVAVLAVTAGCTPFYEIDIGGAGHHYAAQAFGEGAPRTGPADALYYSMGINLDVAPAFTIIFPDGFRVNSKDVDGSMLQDHASGVSVAPAGVTKSWFTFVVGSDNRAHSIVLYACKHTYRGLFATVDGSQVFDFPIRQVELERLIGGSGKVYESSALSWEHCVESFRRP